VATSTANQAANTAILAPYIRRGRLAYDVKVLDKLVTRVAREIRLLEHALKATNAMVRSMRVRTQRFSAPTQRR